MNRFEHGTEHLKPESMEHLITAYQQDYKDFFITLENPRIQLGCKKYWLDTYVWYTLEGIYEAVNEHSLKSGYR